jgi:hypothetical protein
MKGIQKDCGVPPAAGSVGPRIRIATPEEHERLMQAIARIYCFFAEIVPVDPLDGSPNWWIFHSNAAAILSRIEEEALKFAHPSPSSPAPLAEEKDTK